ncbi:sodium/proton antiporter (CPA1 family) [Jezberella montanilacus]|uniref:Sodium/proton antiporter (CPA1 family) n=1 Tax=Jezberella montanilacus TaxID=323426 RepID=A0A2T0XHG1_9BURK|nr:cation:proton antiporter [Jezberella montanilacus]PRY98376.1 sodium/proton antiporter (CPA1 family) [Jezberella montanilacus]
MEIGSLVFGLAGLLMLVCFMPPLAVKLRLPHSLLLAICGFLLAYAAHPNAWLPPVLGDFLGIINTFDVSHQTFLVVFLPVLLFETALAMNVRRLMEDIGPILMLAIVAVFVSTLSVGFLVSQFTPYSLAACLLLGAIVATTDPAAVVGIFKEVGAPNRLMTLVEGESLLNDAGAIAVYTVLLGVVSHSGSWQVGLVLSDTVIMFSGGALTGFVLGRIACELFFWLRGWPAAEISLTLSLAYLSYLVAEHYFGVSGVVATVVAGLVVGSTGRTKMAPNTFEMLTQAWHQFGFWANSLIFLLAAMLIPRLMPDLNLENLFEISLVFVATLFARALVVFGLLPLLSMANLSAGVGTRYKLALCWGGLRGAVSLALALAVIEHQTIPEDIRHFVGVSATGFVLATLVLKGLTLRPLIALLGLNRLSPKEEALRNTALFEATSSVQLATDEIAEAEGLSGQARDKLRAVLAVNTIQLTEGLLKNFSVTERVELGLAIVARHEHEMFFEILKEQLIDEKIAAQLLSRAEQTEDGIRTLGVQGFRLASAKAMRYPRRFRRALQAHKAIGLQRWLAAELAQRFGLLLVMRSAAQLVIKFAEKEVRPLLGEEISLEILSLHHERLALINEGLQALNLQYPIYAMWLQERYLGRIARKLERERYEQMFRHSLLSGAVYQDLLSQLRNRWAFLEQDPRLDIEMGAKDLVARVPLLQGLSNSKQIEVTKLLRPRLYLPDQRVLAKDKPSIELYFVASGAVRILLPDNTHVELGTGEFFGELHLLGQQTAGFEVRSLGYSKLLCLPAKAFNTLLEQDPDLRAHIESVAKQRLRAIEVWQAQQTASGTAAPKDLVSASPNTSA